MNKKLTLNGLRKLMRQFRGLLQELVDFHQESKKEKIILSPLRQLTRLIWIVRVQMTACVSGFGVMVFLVARFLADRHPLSSPEHLRIGGETVLGVGVIALLVLIILLIPELLMKKLNLHMWHKLREVVWNLQEIDALNSRDADRWSVRSYVADDLLAQRRKIHEATVDFESDEDVTALRRNYRRRRAGYIIFGLTEGSSPLKS